VGDLHNTDLMDLHIVELHSDHVGPLFDDSLVLFQSLVAESDPDSDLPTEARLRSKLHSNGTFNKHNVVALDDGRPVGLGRMWLDNLEGTTDRAEAMIEVHPDRRRRGVGIALLKSVLATCDDNGRTSLSGMGWRSDANHAFWTSVGAKLGLVEWESRLWTADTDPDLMDRWVATRQNRAAEYKLVHWQGRTPGEMLDTMAVLLTAMKDAPTDDLVWDEGSWTAQDVVDLDDYYQDAGIGRHVSVVIAPDGSAAGLTEMATYDFQPRFAGQGNTVVIDAHRNRGIGRWLKADMWLRIRSEHPEIVAIDTGNAASNDPMLAINMAMGFARRLEQGMWQAKVETIRQQLA